MKLIVYNIIISLVICMLLGGFSYFLMVNTMTNNTIKQTNMILDQTTKSIDYSISRIEHVSDMIFSNSAITRIVETDNKGSIQDRRMVSEALQHYLVNTDIYNILIISDDGVVYSYGPETAVYLNKTQNKTWYDDVKRLNGKPLWVITDDYKSGDAMITNIRLLKNVSTDRTIGIQTINFSPKIFKNIFSDSELLGSSKTFLIDANGHIIFDPQSGMTDLHITDEMFYSINQSLAEGYEYLNYNGIQHLIIWKDVEKINCKLISVIPVSVLRADANRIIILMLIVVIVVFVIAILYNILISQRLVKPISRLKEYMLAVENGNFCTQTEEKPDDIEIQSLYGSFDNMVMKINLLTQNLDDAYHKKRMAEIHALQAQINPHFLYNTLESVNSLAKINGIEKISDIVISLSELFRVSIGTDTEMIPIWQEISHLQSYLNIRRIRYKDRMSANIYMDETIKHYPIIKLILQPLVENSMNHGFDDSGRNINIHVSIKDANDIIQVTIEDDGKGISDKRLTEIEEFLSNKRRSLRDTEGGHGLKNVNDRLILFYGSDAGLLITSIPHVCTTVSFCIPKNSRENKGETDV